MVLLGVFDELHETIWNNTQNWDEKLRAASSPRGFEKKNDSPKDKEN